MAESLYTQAGIIRFYDGTVIAIERQEYSPDGLTYWEEKFNPDNHLSTIDGITPVNGHKYKRVMHSGDIDWQLPYKIVAETPEFQINKSGDLEWKFEDETEWKFLISGEDLKGEQGIPGKQGVPGEGYHIDIYGFYQNRPDCSESLSSCSTCNPSNSVANNSVTFMSLGDGVLVLTNTLIAAGNVVVDGITYSHFSNDLITWSPISGSIVDFEARYLAIDGTGVVYTDMRTEDYYVTRGLVYICAEGNWTLMQLPTPSYMVGEAMGSTNIGFLDNFVTPSINNIAGTIGLEAGLLSIIEQSITENAFNQNTFGDGISILTPMAKPQITVGDFIGFGLNAYISTTDLLNDIQVNVLDLIGNGLIDQAGISVDGEIRNLLRVDPSELVSNGSGIIIANQPDGYDDFVVNLGNGLLLDTSSPQAITINVDNNSLIVDAANLRIHDYTGTTTGVTLAHLNPDVADVNRGLELDLLNGLFVKADLLTIGFNTNSQLEVPVYGITGDRLNANVVAPLKGIELISNMLGIRIDPNYFAFDGIGALTFLPTANLSVTSIVPILGVTVLDTVRDDVQFNLSDGTGTIANMTSDPGTDVITMDIDIDEAWLEARVQAIIDAGSTTTYWDALQRNSGDPSTIEQYIDSLNHLVENYDYHGDVNINDTEGIVLIASDGSRWRLIVDAQGNLDTISA